MSELKLTYVLVPFVVLALLGALAWGLGWVAHSLLDRGAAPLPTAPAKSVSQPTRMPQPTDTLTSSPTVIPTSTPTEPSPLALATSTPAPTPTRRRIETLKVLDSDRGLYDVVRRACKLPRGYVLASNDKVVQETKQLNDFVLDNPVLLEDQEVKVPVYLCPN